jgi:MoaA/NifB/PqqE/SkfB family radical SAM enzyme
MAAEVGRDPTTVPLSTFGAPEDIDRLEKLRDLGVVRVVVSLDSEKDDKILPILDRWADLVRRVQA